MANLREGTWHFGPRHRYGSFIERYPDYPQWLDGRTWELHVADEIEIHESVNNFRSSLHYQAKALGLRVATKLTTRDGFRYLLVQAYEPQGQ
jgi:hypothetical protein